MTEMITITKKEYEELLKNKCKPHDWEMFNWGGKCRNCDEEWMFGR